MIWLYQRGEQAVRLETRFDKSAEEYTVEITWAEGPPQTERFTDFAEFHARILALEFQLDSEHWLQVGPPSIIPGDWRGPS